MHPETTQIGLARLNPEASPEQTVPAPPNSPASAGPPLPTPQEPLTAEQIEDLRNKIIEALKSCYDPEIPVNIYELGLIYGIEIESTGAVILRMTLTSPACPVAGTLPGEVQRKVLAVPEVTYAEVELVWDPPWDPSKMSEAAKLQLGLDGY